MPDALQAVQQQFVEILDQEMQRVTATLGSSFEHRIYEMNAEIQRSLESERSERHESLRVAHDALTKLDRSSFHHAASLEEFILQHQIFVDEVSPLIRQRVDDGLMSLHSSVQMHDDAIAQLNVVKESKQFQLSPLVAQSDVTTVLDVLSTLLSSISPDPNMVQDDDLFWTSVDKMLAFS